MGATNDDGNIPADAGTQPGGDADDARRARELANKRHDERREKICIIAYYKAQRRGFANSGELDDWLSAEREVDEEERREKSP